MDELARIEIVPEFRSRAIEERDTIERSADMAERTEGDPRRGSCRSRPAGGFGCCRAWHNENGIVGKTLSGAR